jgi:F-type H+-transporting ATPase subunit b
VLIDWFTVAAQIFNFLVLIFLLKHFLYGRIIRAMDQREEKIASRLAEADEKRAKAEEEAGEFRKKNTELAARREELLRQARTEAQSYQEDLVRISREEVERLHSQWRASMAREKEDFLGDLKRRAAGQVLAVTRRALAELADERLERQAVGVFIRRLKGLKPEEREEMKAAIGPAAEGVIVQTAFELSGEDRDRLQRAVKEQLRDGLEITYRTSPDLVLGVELKADGHKVAWSLDHYLRSLEAEITRVLEEEIHRGSEKQADGEKSEGARNGREGRK